MEDILSSLRDKPIKTTRESAIIELYKQLGNYSSDEVTKDTKLFLLSQVYNLPRIQFMNMKIMSAALVMLHSLRISNQQLTQNTFDKIFNTYIKKYFIPVEEQGVGEKKYYYIDIKIDIFRYIRFIKLNQQ